MDGARQVITRMLKPRLMMQMAFYDVASTIHESLGGGQPAEGGGR
jgi:hypothetical protein